MVAMRICAPLFAGGQLLAGCLLFACSGSSSGGIPPANLGAPTANVAGIWFVQAVLVRMGPSKCFTSGPGGETFSGHLTFTQNGTSVTVEDEGGGMGSGTVAGNTLKFGIGGPFGGGANMRCLPMPRLALALPALALLIAGPADTRGQGQGNDHPNPPLDMLSELVEELLSQEPGPDVPQDDGMALTGPLPSPLEGPISWLALEETVAEMEAFLAPDEGGPDPPFSALGLVSLEQAQRALRDLVQLETDFAGAMGHLGLSVHFLVIARSLTDDPAEEAFAVATLLELTGVAKLLAFEGLDRAESAGIDGKLIEKPVLRSMYRTLAIAERAGN